MHYPNYNRNIHDIYLYGPGNTGYPIGINPNSLIAGASADFASVQIRQRQFNTTLENYKGTINLPPGATEGVYPNYYNANTPMCVAISEKLISLVSHYTANKPSDSGPYGVVGNPGVFNKYTGTTTAYELTTLNLWNNTLSGICSYGPFSGFYNFLPQNLLPAGYSFSTPFYFTGSPEISGFANGVTQYLITNYDNAFSQLLNNNQNISVEPIKIISPYEVLTDEQKENLDSFCITFFSSNAVSSNNARYIRYLLPITNVFMWDGNDKIIPADYLVIDFNYLQSQLYYDSYLNSNNFYYGSNYYVLFDDPNCGYGAGDSSSQIVYLNNNKLYFIGAVHSASSNNNWSKTKIPTTNTPKIQFQFAPYQVTTFPNLQGLSELNLDRNHYSTTLNSGPTLATKIDFTRASNKMADIIEQLNVLYANLT